MTGAGVGLIVYFIQECTATSDILKIFLRKKEKILTNVVYGYGTSIL
jgi:Mg2+/Co2+ transporter CorB